MDINTDPGQGRTTDQDRVLSSSPGQDVTMAPRSHVDAGHLDWHAASPNPSQSPATHGLMTLRYQHGPRWLLRLQDAARLPVSTGAIDNNTAPLH